MTPLQMDWLKQWALYAPNSVAFQNAPEAGERSEVWTYGALYRMTQRLALWLRNEHGVESGDRIAVLASNEMEYVALFFAAQRLGAILTPVNFRLTAPEIAHILTDSAANLLIYQEAFADRVRTIDRHALPSKQIKFELIRSCLDEDGDALCPMADVSGGDPCMLLYTSGTTGTPKGAIVTFKMLFWNSLNTSLRLNLSQSDAAISFLPFFHTGGWNVLLTPFVHRGARTIVMRKFDPTRTLEICAREKITILFGVPTTMDMLARDPSFASSDLSSLRYAIVGGEPMPIELIKLWQAKGAPIRQGYGLTEFGPNVFSLNEEDSLRKIGSIGFANFYIEAKVIDGDGQEILDGGVGELALRGPVCTPGYWRNREATAAAIQDGWFMTGDLVRRDDEGYYYVAGRKKEMYISGGENVYPVEVERAMSSHPAIREVAVIGVPDAKWGEVGRAYVALNDDARLSAEELADFCAGRLAKFKTPKQFRFVESLPKSDGGKILKRMLDRE